MLMAERRTYVPNLCRIKAANVFKTVPRREEDVVRVATSLELELVNGKHFMYVSSWSEQRAAPQARSDRKNNVVSAWIVHKTRNLLKELESECKLTSFCKINKS